MSVDLNEIYKILLLAQRPKEDIAKHHRTLATMISQLFDKAVKGEITENSLEKAKKAYVSQLYNRSMALKNSMGYENLAAKEDLSEFLESEEKFLALANYYRSAYYSFFYLGRAIMLHLNDIDYSEHSILWNMIKEKIKEIETSIERLEEDKRDIVEKKAGNKSPKIEKMLATLDEDLILLQMVRNKYKDLKEYREIGDYVMLEEKRMVLANKRNLIDSYNKVNDALNKWVKLQ